MFSNFRDKIEKRGPAAVAMLKAEAQCIEHNAVEMQRRIEQAACEIYETDPTLAMRLLENYARGLYLSCVEVMDKTLSAN